MYSSSETCAWWPIIKKWFIPRAIRGPDSIGTTGLIKGISSFDPEKGARLATYAASLQLKRNFAYSQPEKAPGEVSLSDSIETDKEGNALQLMDGWAWMTPC